MGKKASNDRPKNSERPVPPPPPCLPPDSLMANPSKGYEDDRIPRSSLFKDTNEELEYLRRETQIMSELLKHTENERDYLRGVLLEMVKRNSKDKVSKK